MTKHNPNPFDFVPFQDKPQLYTKQFLDDLGELVSGYMEVELSTLTPVHIVGSLRAGGDRDNWSEMYYQDGRPCVPASTIRGCLRAFVECLTNGWVSQATPEYEKVQGIFRKQEGRHIGFRTFEPYEITYQHRGNTLTRRSDEATSSDFLPSLGTGNKIDIASYLFGIVIEKQDAENSTHAELSQKGKILIEDAYFDSSAINKKKYWYPDLSTKAFMGGGKPSKSNWWYFQPAEIRKRRVTLPSGRRLELAEFVGGKFWGRKFYYHQDPIQCTRHYDRHGGKWYYHKDNPFQKVGMDCIDAENTSQRFRIYVDRLPKALLHLLVLSLMPGSNIRHKIGYGKAYGYGSVEFNIHSLKLRNANPAIRIPTPLVESYQDVCELIKNSWATDLPANTSVLPFIDQLALLHLARICSWANIGEICFTYPPYNGDNQSGKSLRFQSAVPFQTFSQKVKTVVTVQDNISVSLDKARRIAELLFDTKRPIHFRYYQEQANGWEIISSRKP